jgi:hypothetical protein
MQCKFDGNYEELQAQKKFLQTPKKTGPELNKSEIQRRKS